MYALAENEDFHRQEIATYEEVARLMPYPAVPRPIVLIGPPGVGRNELKRRLIALDPDKFRTTIPCTFFFVQLCPATNSLTCLLLDTSRPPKPGEADGVDYHFLDRQQMERDIDDGLFVEFGEYKGNLYGTANRNIKEIIELGYTCILNPHHQALKALRTGEFKPHVVYIKPPGFAVLRELKRYELKRPVKSPLPPPSLATALMVTAIHHNADSNDSPTSKDEGYRVQ